MAEGFARLGVLLVLGFLGLHAAAALETCPDYVATHAPLVWLHSDDPYFPSDIAAHIQHTTPQLDGKSLEVRPHLTMDSLELMVQFGPDVALTSDDDPLSHPLWLMGEAPDDEGRIRNSTPCVVILVPRGDHDVDAFYFYFYSYNEGMNITQVLPPLDQLVDSEVARTGVHFGNHVGDWEHNMVRYKAGKPTGIWYSQHRWGESFRWNDPALSVEDGRPTVYSARGSHANYASSGHHIQLSAMFDMCDEGRRWDPLLSAYFYQLKPDDFSITRLNPPDVLGLPAPTSNLSSFFAFEGRWGDHEWPMSDPRQDSIPQFGIMRFETGPNGPRFKELMRTNLEPTEKLKASWTEWGVYYFMKFYPCCIKGWRKWGSLGAMVVFASLAIIGVILGIKKLRSRIRAKRQGFSAGLGEEEGMLMNDWEEDAEGLLSSDDELPTDSEVADDGEEEEREGGRD